MRTSVRRPMVDAPNDGPNLGHPGWAAAARLHGKSFYRTGLGILTIISVMVVHTFRRVIMFWYGILKFLTHNPSRHVWVNSMIGALPLVFYLVQISASFRNTRHVCADNATTRQRGRAHASPHVVSITHYRIIDVLTRRNRSVECRRQNP